MGLGASAMAAALPVMVYLIVIYRFDRYEREPVWLVGLTFLYGAIGAIILGIVLSVAVMMSAGNEEISFSAGVVAPICEEISKGLIVYLLLLSRHFDNTTDGLIYGAASGLGFAMTENFLYFVQADQQGGMEAWRLTVILRSLFSALMHCAATATFGAILGRFRYRGGIQQWLLAPMLGLLLAMGMHATFNTALVEASKQDTQELMYIAFGLIPLAGITLFVVTLLSTGREHHILAAELREEARLGLIPTAHADILPFHRKRWRKDWCDPRIDKARYIRAATTLAFRKWQSKLPAGARREIHQDVVALRYEVAQCMRAIGMHQKPPPPVAPPHVYPPA
ncbi:MAG: PrsW family intramembrane metalloprotease [Deltaproteobacteria bacterium]|nr:PrsW family intramembrane metalloprotease [Deltaproteobacteria bacterium]